MRSNEAEGRGIPWYRAGKGVMMGMASRVFDPAGGRPRPRASDAWVMEGTAEGQTQRTLVLPRLALDVSGEVPVQDVEGRVMGRVRIQDTPGTERLSCARDLTMWEADGTFAFTARDVLGLDRCVVELMDAGGRPLAVVRRSRTLAGVEVVTEVRDGTRLVLHGDALEGSYHLTAGPGVAAAVRTTAPSHPEWTEEVTQVVVAIDPVAPRIVRLAILGTILVLDLTRTAAQMRV